jgi:hypothetical protein
LRPDDISGHLIFPIREITLAGNVSLRTRITVLAVWAVAPSYWNQRVWGFSTKFLQLRFQICAKHPSVAGWIYCYFPACNVFKEIRANHPKRCYITQHHTTPHHIISLSECKGFWWISRGFSVAQ